MILYSTQPTMLNIKKKKQTNKQPFNVNYNGTKGKKIRMRNLKSDFSINMIIYNHISFGRLNKPIIWN